MKFATRGLAPSSRTSPMPRIISPPQTVIFAIMRSFSLPSRTDAQNVMPPWKINRVTGEHYDNTQRCSKCERGEGIKHRLHREQFIITGQPILDRAQDRHRPDAKLQTRTNASLKRPRPTLTWTAQSSTRSRARWIPMTSPISGTRRALDTRTSTCRDSSEIFIPITSVRCPSPLKRYDYHEHFEPATTQNRNDINQGTNQLLRALSDAQSEKGRDACV